MSSDQIWAQPTVPGASWYGPWNWYPRGTTVVDTGYAPGQDVRKVIAPNGNLLYFVVGPVAYSSRAGYWNTNYGVVPGVLE